MIPSLRNATAYPAEGIVYLDHAATGPLATPTVEAMTAYLLERSRTSPNNFETVLPRLEAGRAAIAQLIGTGAENVEYVPNTSYGINVLARGLAWKAGDRVAVPESEFPANLLPWLALEPLGVTVDRIPCTDGCFSLQDAEAALTPQTRVLAVSWVQFLSGFRAPLAELGAMCRARGVLLAVDGIQGVGALEMRFDELGLDFLASGGQKWMLGPQGSAFVAVAPALQTQLEPMRGWLNGPVDWEDFGSTGLDVHPDATRFRVGTLATAPILGLLASVEQFLDAGTAEVESSVLRASGRLGAALDALGLSRWGASGEPRSGIVTYEHGAPDALREHLLARGVWISVRDRKLRFAPHATTSDDDLDRTAEAVRDFARTSVPVA
ncbi:aminotransferase class V-fold PLP-dependent enzyme [Rubricoccus marinus]|uniref:Aminotransferase class V domain-containing protein n=1 Tax=Rubricoccus marinus TaxID=716817 RepID=A0A259TZ30_9BACT|nr:aminotransferase class V-fold PLP-dependent enzyme [Rubricoccus marinus]OZC03033.1 hypothetical protein BSZ36_08665 [Rubricoccus marinus]